MDRMTDTVAVLAVLVVVLIVSSAPLVLVSSTASGVRGATATPTPSPSTPEYVYTGASDGDVVKHYASNGSKVWQQRYDNDVGSLLVDSSDLFIGTDQRLIRANDTGSPKWNLSITSGKVQSIVAVEDYVFAANGSTILRVNKKTGNVSWRFDHTDNIAALTVGQKYLYAGTTSGNITRLTRLSGTPSLNKSVDSNNADVQYYKGYLYVAARNDGKFYRLTPDFDEVANNTTTGRAERLAVTSNGVYIEDADIPGSGTSDIELYTFALDKKKATAAVGQTYEVEAAPDGDIMIGQGSGGEYKYKPSLSERWNTSHHDDNVVAISTGITYDTFNETQDDEELTLQVKSYLEHNQTAPYTVQFKQTDSNGTILNASDVTNQATVTSGNVSVLVADNPNTEIIATSDTSINATVTVTAEYVRNGTVYQDSTNVTVASLDVSNVDIIPGPGRISASFSDDGLFAILIATLVGIVAARLSTSFGGLSGMVMALIVAWFGGFISTGIMLVAVFTGAFIGLNVAANIDYTGPARR